MGKSRKRNHKNRHSQEQTEDFYDLCDDTFAFIAGYTSGGAPYGSTWEEMGIDPDLPLAEKIRLLGGEEEMGENAEYVFLD